VLLCPRHHRLHHTGELTLTGPADRLVVTDNDGHPIERGSLAHPPSTAPPEVAPYQGPTGERARWWWYQPFEPPPTPSGDN
jgi:acetyl esterase/lipase